MNNVQALVDEAAYVEDLGLVDLRAMAAQLRTQHALLVQARDALNAAFDYEGDVFGRYHNEATDTLAAINQHLEPK
jgi:hypothetical protein